MVAPSQERHAIYRQVLAHLLARVESTPATDAPFSHVFFEEILPPALYPRLLAALPDPTAYQATHERYHVEGEANGFVRLQYQLGTADVPGLGAEHRELWLGVLAALTDQAFKRAVFARLHKDLDYRYGCGRAGVADLAGYARPMLYRETEGFEIPPHPDTRRKVVTMALYLPADDSQVDLGTGLYRRRLLALPLGSWRGRFDKVKQFPFKANSAYAFVVNNSLGKKSWHGREKLPPGAGVRNTLLNTFYEEPREGYAGYLDFGRARAA